MTTDELLAEKQRLRAENAELKQRLAELEAVVQDLKGQLEAARRAYNGFPLSPSQSVPLTDTA